MKPNFALPLPRYQCHKQVRALKIQHILRKPNPDTTGRSAAASYGAVLTPHEDNYVSFDVSAEYMCKHKPEVGGYYVVYEDGYESYSPASAFESGYSLCNPHTGALRDPRDVASDPQAILCTKPGEPLKAAPGPVVFGDEEHVAVPRGLIGAACSAIDQKRDAPITLAELRRYTFGDKSAALPQAASIALPVVDPGPDSLEREIQAKASNAPRVTPADVRNEIVGETFTLLPSGRVTVCELTLKNGFTVRGESAVVFIENFNEDIGRKVARENAEKEVWQLLGFRLRDELARPVLTDADAAADLAGTPRPNNPTAEAADFLAGRSACSLAGEGACEACQ